MCGIIGYVGKGVTLKDITDGLERLEYRGYDSSGIAFIELGKSSLNRYRSVGSIIRLNGMATLTVRTVIGHTRWATHGVPDVNNAHPHLDCHGKIAVVHNGIIENYKALREELESRGHRFLSDTDSEVLAHLIEEEYERERDMKKAFVNALRRLKGSYAVAVISSHEPDVMFVGRNESPLILGRINGGYYVASDIPAFLPYTRDVYVMENGQWALLSSRKLELFDVNGDPIRPRFERISWDLSFAEKGGYKHFMLKEIFEQPKVLREGLEGRLLESGVDLEANFDAKGIKGVTYVACGTSYHAALVGSYYSWQLAKLPADAVVASEFRYFLQSGMDLRDRLFVFLSQSGETADTLAALRRLKALYPDVKILGITNVVASSLYRESSPVLIRAGMEIGVAATKTFTAQLLTLLLLNLKIGLERGMVSPGEYSCLKDKLETLPSVMDETLETYERVFNVADRFVNSKGMLYLGRNLLYPIALEGALKLKEISYIHAEGYPAGEMKHGPIALIDDSFPSVILMPYNELMEKMYGNYKEVLARKGPTVIVTDLLAVEEFSLYGENLVKVPLIHTYLQPIVVTAPLQLLAYRIADRKGLDVDRPRNLAKSVTVE